jgi:peptidoglycan lytic transglycosylase G
VRVTSAKIWQALRTHARLFATLALVVFVVTSIVVMRFADKAINAPLTVPQEGLVLMIESGSTFRRIANGLHDDDVLEHPRILEWYARITGKATQIKVGEYAVTTGTTAGDLIDQLIAGRVILHRFTIIEGWRTADLMGALAAQEAIANTGVTQATVMAALGEPELHPEGQFLPDTYSFPRGTTDLQLLRQAHEALRKVLEAAWAERSPDATASSPYHALVLASIIEKETALASERPQISGVFNRRLARGIRLQADPTVIYGLGDAFDGNLRTVDLETDTPYNTYTRRGLPPTPIALPGLQAIEAALNPAPGDEIYFVATGDGDGSHYFSATLEEHNAAVQRYLAKLRSSR